MGDDLIPLNQLDAWLDSLVAGKTDTSVAVEEPPAPMAGNEAQPAPQPQKEPSPQELDTWLDSLVAKKQPPKRSTWQSAQEQAIQETEHELGVSRKDDAFDWAKAQERAVQIYQGKVRGEEGVMHPRKHPTFEEAARMEGQDWGQFPIAGRVVTGIAQAGGDIASTALTAAGALGVPGAAEAGAGVQRATEALGQGADEEAQSYLGQMLQGAVRSLASQFLGYTTGLKGAQYITPVLTQASQSYNEGKEAGLRGKDLAGYVLANASAEAIYALAAKGLGKKLGLPLEGVEDMRGVIKGGLREVAKKFGWGLLGELGEEELTTIQQALARKVYDVGPGLTTKDLFDTAVQTIMMMGLAKSPTIAHLGNRALKKRSARYKVAKEILQQRGVEPTKERVKAVVDKLASKEVQQAVEQQQAPSTEEAAPVAEQSVAQEQPAAPAEEAAPVEQPEAQVIPPETQPQQEPAQPPQTIQVKPEDLNTPVVEPPKVEDSKKDKLLGTKGVKPEAKGRKLAGKLEVIVLRGPNGEDITPTKEERVQNIESDEFLSQLDYEIEQLRKAGVPNEAIEKFRRSALFGAVDELTGMQAANLRTPAMNRVLQWAGEKNQPASYAEIDVKNLGGLNAKLGHTRANKVYSRFAEIIREELDRAFGKQVQFFRHGGDEMSVIGMGVDSKALDAALEKAKNRITEYVKEQGLADIVHPKHKNDLHKRGSGVEYQAIDALPGMQPDEVFATADIALEAKKGGGENVQRSETTAAGAPSPEGQAPGTPEGLAGPGGEVEAAGGTAEQTAPAAEPGISKPINKMTKAELVAAIAADSDKQERALKTYHIAKLRKMLREIRSAKPAAETRPKSIEQRIKEATTLDEIDAIAEEVDKAGQLAKYEKALDKQADRIMAGEVEAKKEAPKEKKKPTGTVEERIEQATSTEEIREIADTLDEAEWEKHADLITKRLDEVVATQPFAEVEKSVDEMLKDESLTPNQRKELEESRKRAQALAEEQQKLLDQAEQDEIKRELEAFGYKEKDLADKRADELRALLDQEIQGMMEAPGGELRTPEGERNKMRFWAGEALKAMGVKPTKFAHEIRRIVKERNRIRRRITKIQQQINRATGVKKVDESEKVVRSKAQLYKMILRAKQVASNLGYRAGVKEGRKLGVEKEKAKRKEERDWQKTLLGIAQELPVEIRGAAMSAVVNATTPGKAAAALKRIDVLQAHAEHRAQVKKAQKAISRMRKLYGKDLHKMHPIYQEMVSELIDGIDKQALSKKSQQIAEKLHELAASDEELTTRLSKKNLKLMDRLGKTALTTLDTDELQSLVERLQTIHHRQRLHGKLFHRGKLRSVETEAKELENIAKDVQKRGLAVGGENEEWIEPRSHGQKIADALTKTKMKLELMDAMREDGPGHRLLEQVKESNDTYGLDTAEVRDVTKQHLDRDNILDPESERKLHENVNVKMSDGALLRLPRSVLLSLALTAKDEKGRRMLLRSPLFLPEVDKRGKYHRGVKATTLGKPERKGERVSRYDKAEKDVAAIEEAAANDKIIKSYMDLWAKLRDNYFYNWVNEAILKTEGHSLPKKGNWFPLRRHRGDVEPKGIDDYQTSRDIIKDWASRKERTEIEGYPLEIRPFHEVLNEVVHHSALIHAYADTYHNIQTLLGREDVRNNLDRMHGRGFADALKKELMDAIGTERDRVEMGKLLSRWAAQYKNKSSVSVLLGNVRVWLAQPLSYLEAGTIIPMKYLLHPKVLAGSASAENRKILDAIRSKEISPKLWARKEGQAFDREVADIVRPDDILSTLAGEKRLRDKYGKAISKPMTFSDDIAVSRIALAAHRWAQDQLGKGASEQKVLKKAAQIAEHAIEETQPDNERINRNPMSKAAHGVARLFWQYRGYRDANLNNIMRSYYKYKYSNRTQADAAKLAKNLALTLPLPIMLNILRVYGYEEALGYLGWLYKKLMGPEEEKRPSRIPVKKKPKKTYPAQEIAAKGIDEVTGRVPIIGEALAYFFKHVAAPKAIKPWDEDRAKNVVGSVGQYLAAPGNLVKAIRQGRADKILRQVGILVGRTKGLPLEGPLNLIAAIIKPSQEAKQKLLRREAALREREKKNPKAKLHRLIRQGVLQRLLYNKAPSKEELEAMQTDQAYTLRYYKSAMRTLQKRKAASAR